MIAHVTAQLVAHDTVENLGTPDEFYRRKYSVVDFDGKPVRRGIVRFAASAAEIKGGLPDGSIIVIGPYRFVTFDYNVWANSYDCVLNSGPLAHLQAAKFIAHKWLCGFRIRLLYTLRIWGAVDFDTDNDYFAPPKVTRILKWRLK